MRLKECSLRWFMGSKDDSITSWDDMKKYFLKNYHDFHRARNSKEDIFYMQQREE